MSQSEYQLTTGRITDLINLDDSIIRFISASEAEEGEEQSGYVGQGHITSKSEYPLDDISIDISYKHSSGDFLGLDKNSIFDIDELSPKETIPFEIDLDIADNTAQCVINISAKERKGLFARLMFGTKKEES